MISLEVFDKYREKFIENISKYSSQYQYIYFDCEYGMLTFIEKCVENINSLTKVIVGGTYINYLYAAGCLPKVSKNITFLIIGDVLTVISDICMNREKFVQKINGKIEQIITLDRADLDLLPNPRWDIYDLKNYDESLQIVAAMGCKYGKCKFCDERLIFGEGYRIRNIDNVINEIKENIKKFKVKHFCFWDASIVSHPKFKELCKRLIVEKIVCTWSCLARADEIQYADVALMRNAGCIRVELGIESLVSDVLRSINKGITLNEIQTAVSSLQATGIKVEGSFVIGYPEDTKEGVLYTIKKSQELNLCYYRWHNIQIPARKLKEMISMLNIELDKIDLNYPDYLLSEVLSKGLGNYFEMHVASKTKDNPLTYIPSIYVGNLSLQDIYKLIYYAEKKTNLEMLKEGLHIHY